MRILYVAMKYGYGKPEHGYSFEHYNFYNSLLHMGHHILYFDFMTLTHEHGRQWMNCRLREVIATEKPDLLFCVLFENELDRNVMREISENNDTITLNWFCDDHWRFDSYSRYWAPCFNWVVTTAGSAIPKYDRLGYGNVIKSQWACNQFLYSKMDLRLDYDVTFVGRPHGNRCAIIQALRDAGIDVHVWGSGWESGRLSQEEEMIRVFNQSRINLNLSNASTPITTPQARVSNMAPIWLSRFLNVVPFGSQLKTMGRRWLSIMRQAMGAANSLSRPNAGTQLYFDQIKGRNFEVPGCGGFLLTGRADNLEEYYEIGEEVEIFEDMDDLIEKVSYYLNNGDRWSAIAVNGYQRTLREHTYVHRFTEIFRRIGLPWEPCNQVMEGKVRLGQTEEIH